MSKPLSGMTVGQYRIEGKLGQGGMGFVYRAVDTKLKRSVAVKFLSAEIASDEARRRFQREAQMASSLNHPHIITVHDVGDWNGEQYIVTEFVDGGTLSHWAAAAPHSWRNVVELLTGVAEGLAAAHEAGIFHRDIKPGNILVSRSGYAKLADFGLAKLEDSSLDETRTGTKGILGTTAYMSPEQATGGDSDARSDIFSFGVVLYEMLAGKRPFDGNSPPDIIQKILVQPPPPLSDGIPPALRNIVEKALEKEPADRYQSMREMVVDLRRVTRRGDTVSDISRPAPDIAPRSRWWIPAIALLVIAVVVVVITLRPGTPSTNGPLHLQIPPPPGGRFVVGMNTGGMAVSPNGEMLAAVATGDGASSLWVESLRDGGARKVPRSFLAQRPFWSPDSKFIGFFAEGGGRYGLYRVDAAGGEPVLVTALAFALVSGSWTEDGQILISNGATHELEIVPASGGTPKRLLAGASFPQALPGGNFIFWNDEPPAIDAAPIAHPENRKRLVNSSGHGVYAAGYLLWRDGTALLAQKFDPSTLSLSGEPQRLLDTIAVGAINEVSLTVSTRRLIYDSETNKGLQLAWYNRAGQPIAPLGPAGSYRGFRLFDGQRVMVQANDEKDRGCWLIDDKGIPTRLLSGEVCLSPTPAPDGKAMIYGLLGQGLLRVDITGQNGTFLPVPDRQTFQFPTDWSGDFLLFSKGPEKDDIWSVRLAPDGSVAPGAKPELYLRTAASETFARFAPDHNQRWLAYQSDESGQWDIYVQSFPMKGAKVRISPQGGINPVWGPEGRELFYLSLDDKLMAVHMAYGPNFVSNSTPHELFPIPPSSGIAGATVDTLDGQHFLVLAPVAPANRPMQVIDNWTALLH